MPSILQRLRSTSERGNWPQNLTIDDYLSIFGYGGFQYPLGMQTSMPGSKAVYIGDDFAAYVQQIHKRNGVVAAAVAARSWLISELRFKWRSEIQGENGRMFGDASLAPLEHPAADLTRSTLLATSERHVSYAGNAFFNRTDADEIRLLHPQWTDIILGSDTDPNLPGWQADTHLVGYGFHPGGRGQSPAMQFFTPAEVAHWMPEPDPDQWWRGESWVTSVLREIVTDGQATDHQSKFYENAATPQVIFSLDPRTTLEQAKAYQEMVDERTAGVSRAYRNLVIGGGASATVVGSQLAQLSLRDTQGGYETRIAARARVPAVILGIREGMAGSALNSGNYLQTRRLWSDTWFTPAANNLCETFERIVPPPATSTSLTFDPARISFLQEDRKDEAEIQNARAQSIRSLYEAGFEPATIVSAVSSGDFSQLKHTGRPSIQTAAPTGTVDAASGGGTSNTGASA